MFDKHLVGNKEFDVGQGQRSETKTYEVSYWD